ncbi:elongation factor G-like protein EF-G2 [[Mycobacterium] crassicus]|uniref:Elongation factor G-like protein EF-G2 n=1 Tax=[Mycobacterium] crassicus TaxID=2872309 RepID=A0ABU5XRW7_9MYCO|nr:elongation factor G-like protein EF-G2 [Mycolicibacter sp. MYC098]MEB3023816.1 elongation factor G-like protein EF-G2 [Mycolicibacter sp. MYC098]
MADKTTTPRNGAAPTAADPAAIRNVVLIGPPGSGKTTLVEAMLVSSGVLPRAGSIIDGSTVCDYDDVEIRQQRSVGVACASLAHEGVKINLIDTPGYADFIGEVRAGLRAADSALFVVAANEDIDDATTALWQECSRIAMPRAVVVTKLDHARADYPASLAAARAAFGAKVMPLYLPIGADGSARLDEGEAKPGPSREPAGLVALLTTEQCQAADAELRRGELIEAIIEESEDESLLERYLGGEQIDQVVLTGDLERAVARGSFFPVIPACSSSGVGISELLGVITAGFPSPPEHRLPEAFTPDGVERSGLSCDPTGPLLAEVVRTTSDPYVGRVSLVRVFSGTIKPDSGIHVSGHCTGFFGEASGHSDHDEDDRIGALAFPLGRHQRPATAVMAGDICTVGRLSHAETGDTLSDKAEPLVCKPWSMPDPLLPVAVIPHAKTDEDKLAVGLARLAAEDPSLRIERNPETHQTVLWCMGEAHSGIVLDTLANRYAVAVDTVALRVALRETFGTKAKGHGRHVKQSGGHGQYAVCDITVEPLAQGSGFEFVDRVVGGAVPRQFIPSVEKGVQAQMERGLTGVNGYPVVDIRVSLLDGKAHSVDSSDFAFQMAGAAALRDAATTGRVQLLEPIDDVTVLIPDDLVGTVMGDLSARRARVLGTDKVGSDRTCVKAEVPQTELIRYAVDLRSLTHGAGSFTRGFARYEPLPESAAAHAANSA